MNTRDLHIPSNKVCDIERYCYMELATIYNTAEIQQLVRSLFEGFMGWSTAQFLLNKQSTINQSDLLRFHWAVEDLKKHRPIQYIIGHTKFCDCHISVNEDVLIPRPETEEIVTNIAQQSAPYRNILDICTGSGCIAIALKKFFPEASVCAIDISERALRVAQNNANSNKTEIEFKQADILQSLEVNTKWDLIVSNPPYVMRSEATNMDQNVLAYEPGLALWVDDNDPLLFYRAIGDFAQKHLDKNGLLVVEINENLGNETMALLQEKGFHCQLHKDFRDKVRSIWATRADASQSL